MHRDGVGDLQFVEVLGRVHQPPVVHAHHHGALPGVDALHDADVAVVGSHALFPADALPDDLVVVAHLHHLVPHPEHPGGALQLRLAFLGRVEQVLQLHVQRLRAGGAKLCGTQHLNIPDGIKAVAPGQPSGNKIAHQTLRSLAVRFQKEEVVGFAALLQWLAGDDMVRVFHDETAFCLPEDLVQADSWHAAGADDLAATCHGLLPPQSHRCHKEHPSNKSYYAGLPVSYRFFEFPCSDRLPTTLQNVH